MPTSHVKFQCTLQLHAGKLAHRRCDWRAVENPEHLTGEWTQRIATRTFFFKKKCQRKMTVVQWRSHVVDLMNDLDDILAARGREVSAVPAHQFE